MVTMAPEKTKLWFTLRCSQWNQRTGAWCTAVLARIEGDELKQPIELYCRQCRNKIIFE